MSAAVRHLILLPGDFRAVTEKIYNGFLSGIQLCNTGFFIEVSVCSEADRHGYRPAGNRFRQILSIFILHHIHFCEYGEKSGPFILFVSFAFTVSRRGAGLWYR